MKKISFITKSISHHVPEIFRFNFVTCKWDVLWRLNDIIYLITIIYTAADADGVVNLDLLYTILNYYLLHKNIRIKEYLKIIL